MLKAQSLVVALLALSSVGYAAEKQKASGETSVKMEDVNKEAEQAVKKSSENDEADQVITNKKLRAESGSLSKWSVSTSLNYKGGSVEKPGDAVRPNIMAAQGTPALAAIAGNVGIKYRTSKLTSATLGVGLAMTAPFQSKAKSNDPGIQEEFKRSNNKLEANDPSLTLTMLNKMGKVQSVTNLVGGVYTTQYYRDLGFANTATLQQIFAYDVGASGLTLGVSFQINAYGFDKNKNTVVGQGKTAYTLGSRRSDWGAGIYPYMEYTINDRFSLRTISGLWLYQHNDMDSNFWRMRKLQIYQSVGVGISVTRDIYIYPNVQFLPENIRSDMTNVAINTNINVF